MEQIEEMKETEETKSKLREILEYVAIIIVGVIAALLIRSYVGQLFFVNGESMEPTFQNADFAISSKVSYYRHSPERGDVVIVEADVLNHKKIIKRVIGVEGDTIEIKNNVLYRNGKKIKESYINEKMDTPDLTVTVPKDEIFVMGDNRNNSTDSRFIGSFPLEKVQGKVVMELWNNPFKRY